MEKSGFRKAAWGASISEVKELESAELVSEDETSLMYRDEFVGYPAFIFYTFDRDGLLDGGYHFNHHDDRVDGVIYTQLRDLLEKKYGEYEEKMNWRNPLRVVEIETVGDLGLAVAAGYLDMYCSWSSGDTRISLMLNGSEGWRDAHVLLVYKDSRPRCAAESDSAVMELL